MGYIRDIYGIYTGHIRNISLTGTVQVDYRYDAATEQKINFQGSVIFFLYSRQKKRMRGGLTGNNAEPPAKSLTIAGGLYRIAGMYPGR
jgi:hypothetical protein